MTYTNVYATFLIFFAFCNKNHHFLTPVYSSTVFELIVVVVFVESDTCVYVEVVLIVRHALQLVKAMALAPIKSIIKIFLIV